MKKITLFLGIMLILAVAVPAFAEELEVIEAAIAKNIVDRTPVDIAGAFTADVGKLWCYSKIKGGGEGIFITHRWYYKNSLAAVIPLEVKYPVTRTYSNKRIPPESKGEWKVDITKTDGTVLKSVAFTVE